MLVSAIANFQAIGAQHRAGMAMMNASNNMMSGLRNVGAGETNFNALHQQDVKNDTDMAKAQFMYKVASAWKKHTEAQMKKDLDKGLDYKA